MLNNLQSFSEKALPIKFTHNHRLKIQPSQNIYLSPRNYDFTHTKPNVEALKSQQRIVSKPKEEYLRFQRKKSKRNKDRYADNHAEQKPKEAAKQKIRTIPRLVPTQYYSTFAKSSRQFEKNTQERPIYQKSNMFKKDQQVSDYKQQIKNVYQSSEFVTDKMEITFNIESTEPDQPQKSQKNQYNFCISNKATINRNALQIWKKRKMERQIKEKEGEYRSLIRSLSKKNEKQKSLIKNKMKDVLDQLFVLSKEVKK